MLIRGENLRLYTKDKLKKINVYVWVCVHIYIYVYKELHEINSPPAHTTLIMLINVCQIMNKNKKVIAAE